MYNIVVDTKIILVVSSAASYGTRVEDKAPATGNVIDVIPGNVLMVVVGRKIDSVIILCVLASIMNDIPIECPIVGFIRFHAGSEPIAVWTRHIIGDYTPVIDMI